MERYTIQQLKHLPIQIKVYSEEQAIKLGYLFGYTSYDWRPSDAFYPIYITGYNETICNWEQTEDYFKNKYGINKTIEPYQVIEMKELPKYFAIKRQKDNPLWQKYINWLNDKYDARFRGKLHGKNEAYYGYDGMTDCYSNIELFKNSPIVLTLEEWDDILNGRIKDDDRLTYGGQIKDFPIEVVEKMLEKQAEQGNKRDVSAFELHRTCLKLNGGFDWHKTSEGGYFWKQVIWDKQFDVFFEKYPKFVDNISNNNNKEESDRKIIGYKTPSDLWGGEIKKGELYTPVKNSPTNYQWDADNDETYFLPKEVVETWEPVYEEEYKVGDWVTTLPGFSGWISEGIYGGAGYKENLTLKIREISSSGYVLFFERHKNGIYKHCVRKATTEEIEATATETVRMGGESGFDLTIKNGKVFHKSEEITEFVKELKEWWTNLFWMFSSNGGTRKVRYKDIIYSQTGCEHIETSIHEWLKVAKKAGI